MLQGAGAYVDPAAASAGAAQRWPNAVGAVVSSLPAGGWFPRLAYGDSFVQTGGGGRTAGTTQLVAPADGRLVGMMCRKRAGTDVGITLNVHLDQAVAAAESVTEVVFPAGAGLFVPLSAEFTAGQLVCIEVVLTGNDFWWTLVGELD